MLSSLAPSVAKALNILKYGVDGNRFANACKPCGIESIGQEYPETKNNGQVEKAIISVHPMAVLKNEANKVVYIIKTEINSKLNTRCKKIEPLKPSEKNGNINLQKTKKYIV